jgi:hypothetical protein
MPGPSGKMAASAFQPAATLPGKSSMALVNLRPGPRALRRLLVDLARQRLSVA